MIKQQLKPDADGRTETFLYTELEIGSRQFQTQQPFLKIEYLTAEVIQSLKTIR